MEIISVYEKFEKFFKKYIPQLSDEELDALQKKLIKARKTMNAKEFLGQFCIEMAVAQSIRSEQQYGIKFGYYNNSLELIIMNIPIFQKEKLIGSIGSGSGLFEIFAARNLFPESHLICMDLSPLCCYKSKKTC